MKKILPFLLLFLFCVDDQEANQFITIKGDETFAEIQHIEKMYPETEHENRPKSYYIINSTQELDHFKKNLFDFDISLPKSFFAEKILIIHPKATFNGPVENIHAEIEKDKISLRYYWKDGYADCYCFVLILLKVRIVN